MIDKKNRLFNVRGLSTNTKQLPALDPDSFGFDERNTADLLTFILEYSKHVRFKNLQNKNDGSWSVFFEDDLAFLLAKIHNTNVEEISAKFNAAVIDFEAQLTDNKEKKYLLILGECIRLFVMIDRWYKSSKRDIEYLEKNVLDPHLKSAIGLKLAPHLARLRTQLSLLSSSIDGDGFDLTFLDELDALWRVEHVNNEGSTEQGLEISWSDFLAEASAAHRDAIGVVTHLKHRAPDLLNSVIDSYPYHEPHVSLIVAFIKVFKHAQGDMNNITRRHLDYYYKEILNQSKRAPEADKVHVFFELADHAVTATIKSGTLLTSGVDEEGLDRTYSVDNDLKLGRSHIDDIRVIHVANNPSIGIGKAFKDVSNIYSTQLDVRDDGYLVNIAGNPASAYPFGRDQADISLVHRDMDQAEVGFAISSSVLAMKEGERKASFTFKYNLKSLTSLVSFVEEIAINENLTADNAFYKILNDVFRIRFTTAEGWHETESYNIVRHNDWSDGEVRINLDIDISEPSIVNYDEELHGDGYEAKWPVCEFFISSRYAMYAYSYLKDLLLESCTIETEVNKVRDVSIFNDQGQLDNHMPFFPLGSTPTVGSYFLLGYDELFDRSLSELSIDIHWHNLPRDKGGFEVYFKEYPDEISNESFKMGMTALCEYHFHPEESELLQQFDLFHGRPNEALVPTVKLDQIDLERLKIQPNYEEVDTSEYTSRTRTGFLKFELLTPEMGFGFDSFPKLFSEAIVKNSKVSSGILGSKELPSVELPNEAFAPQIRSISLNYRAKTVLTFTADGASDNDERVKDQLYHIHPFGKQAIFKNGLPINNAMLPRFDREGYLLLGLVDINAPETLTIFFQLEYNTVNTINYTDIPTIEWSFLMNDEWIDFEESQIVSDGTNNFTTSGIVELKVPEKINKDHNILPSEKYWISAAAPSNTQILSRIQFIKTNGARATWSAHKENAVWENTLSPGSIGGFVETRPDINVVSQPFSSFGGSPGETDSAFYNRVSHRLKHKNRAIVPEDFERIILDRFPSIYQVLCLNNSRFPEFIKPGEVKVIVVPKIDVGTNFILPRVDYNQLTVIEDEISRVISPFVKLNVINPVYEKVRISCNVQFTNQLVSGELVARLENDLRSLICPWFSSEQREMVFGGSLERSAILSFIESLEYVNFVTRLSVVVLHFKDGEYSISDSAADDGKVNTLVSSTPWSVLVPDQDHDIVIIDRTIHGAAKETRIDTMKVGSDFVISDEPEERVSYPYFDTEKDVYYSIEIDL